MSDKTLNFNNTILNKKTFHTSKKPIDLLSVDLDQIVVSHKFKHNDEGFKYFIGYLKSEIVKPLCIILPQKSGYTNFLNNGVPKENIHYSCIAYVTIDSVINFNKKNHLQVYLEQFKYRIKKIQMPKFIKKRIKSRFRVRFRFR